MAKCHGEDLTLTTRLSVFFLAMLGVVLLGFSIALYALADRYLSRRTWALQDLTEKLDGAR